MSSQPPTHAADTAQYYQCGPAPEDPVTLLYRRLHSDYTDMSDTEYFFLVTLCLSSSLFRILDSSSWSSLLRVCSHICPALSGRHKDAASLEYSYCFTANTTTIMRTTRNSSLSDLARLSLATAAEGGQQLLESATPRWSSACRIASSRTPRYNNICTS